MERKLQEILGDLSYDDLVQALESKKHSRIEELRGQKAELLKELKSVQAEYASKIGAVDRELEELTGRKSKTVVRTAAAGGGGRSGELTNAILECLKKSGDVLTPAQIKAMLPEAGYTGPLDEVGNKVSMYLGRMVKRGKVERVGRGEYRAVS